MKFLTSYYRQQGENTSLVLQQCCCAGREILFACVCSDKALDEKAEETAEKKEEENVGENAEMLAELLFAWFRGLRLVRAVRMPEEFMDGQMRELERVLRRRLKMTDTGCAGFFCLDGEFLSFCGGDATVRVLNRQMGKTQISRLFPREENGERKWKKTGSFRVLRGSIEPEVGVLLVTGSMLRAVTEESMAECLSVETLRTEERTSKHLWELGSAGERAGGRNMAAVLLRSREESGVCMPGGGSICKRSTLQETECGRTAAVLLRSREEHGAYMPDGGSICKGSTLQKVECGRTATMQPWRETESVQESAALEEHGYRIERRLGQGSFSEVYLVRSVSGAHYACKVSRRLDLLKEEAEVLKKLKHSLFPKYREYWQGQAGYLVMEYVAGQSLEEHLQRRKGFSVRRTLQLGLELSCGLLYLHEEMGLVYRDIKPANVILGQDGKARLVDLGCAWKMEETPHTRAGTPGFAAPEQLSGARLTAACDVYGLGKLMEVTLRESSKGSRNAARRLRRLIASCTEEDPQVRHGEMRSVIRVLSQTAEGKPGRRGDWEEEILKGRLRVRKNIWESSHKNS